MCVQYHPYETWTRSVNTLSNWQLSASVERIVFACAYLLVLTSVLIPCVSQTRSCLGQRREPPLKRTRVSTARSEAPPSLRMAAPPSSVSDHRCRAVYREDSCTSRRIRHLFTIANTDIPLIDGLAWVAIYVLIHIYSAVPAYECLYSSCMDWL